MLKKMHAVMDREENLIMCDYISFETALLTIMTTLSTQYKLKNCSKDHVSQNFTGS